MKRVVQAGGIAILLLVMAVAAVPSHIELEVTPVGADPAAVSGWLESAHDGRVMLSAEGVPWEHQLAARGMAGRFETDGAGRVRVRATLFKGSVRLSELELVGTRVSITNERGHFTGTTR